MFNSGVQPEGSRGGEQGSKKCQRMSGIFVGLRTFSSGRGAVYREYLFSCAESGKNLVSFYVRYPQPHQTVPGTLRNFGWGDNFRGVKLFWLFIEHGRERIADRV